MLKHSSDVKKEFETLESRSPEHYIFGTLESGGQRVCLGHVLTFNQTKRPEDYIDF